MLPLAESLSILASIASIRGQQAQAAELAEISRRLADRDGSPAAADAATLRDVLARIRDEGPDPVIAAAINDLPRDLRALVDAGLSVPEVHDLHQATGGTSAGDLKAALETDAGQTVHPHLRTRALAVVSQTYARRSRTPLGRGWTLADTLSAAVRNSCPEVERVEPTGSLRRFMATVADLDLLAASTDPPRTIGRLLSLPFVSGVLHAGPAKIVLRLERAELTIRIVRPEVYGAALVMATGSPGHVTALQRRAHIRALVLSPEGLRTRDGRPSACADEHEVYSTLGLPWIAPELREDAGEIEAADAGRLPDLVRREHVRGDLHMHSDWSDGRDSMDLMAAAAEALGYEYVAITDHSQSSAIARGLDVARLEQQMDAVAALRARHPRLTILQGAEVDILPDGSLDFPDAVLERLEVVLASLHDAAGHDGSRLTDRYIAAMRHPLVQIVTHPTNRMVPGRDGYALDEERFFAAAVDSGTILEIDGAPGHLDMDGAMARRAIAAGATVAIDGDCHRAELLGRQMAFGVATARRGWVEARHVVNALPLDALRARLGWKRGAR